MVTDIYSWCAPGAHLERTRCTPRARASTRCTPKARVRVRIRVRVRVRVRVRDVWRNDT